MPPGGRVLLIALTAPAWGARVCLLALLDWAIISVGYGLAGRAVPALEEDPAKLIRLRDDGAIARTLGMLVRGQLLPLPPAILGVAAVATLVILGLHGLPSILIVGPAIVMLLAAPGSSNRHGGRFDWLVPVLLLAAQILYLAGAGLATGVPGPVIFVLCATLLLRYADLAFPGRPVMLVAPRQPGSEAAERGTGLGWEGRLLFAGVAAALGIATYAYIALAAYLGGLIGAKAVASCLRPRPGDGARSVRRPRRLGVDREDLARPQPPAVDLEEVYGRRPEQRQQVLPEGRGQIDRGHDGGRVLCRHVGSHLGYRRPSRVVLSSGQEVDVLGGVSLAGPSGPGLAALRARRYEVAADDGARHAGVSLPAQHL